MAVFVLPIRDLDNLKPSQLLDQHIGLGLKHADIMAPFTGPQYSHGLLRCPSYRGSCRRQRWMQDNGSVVKCNKDQFQVSLDVQQFSPDEVTVKVVNNSIVVDAKHDEKPDEHGIISRQFVRKYEVPEGHDIQQVASSLSSDGILTISAPKTPTVEAKERIIPITQTGPHKIVKEKEPTEEKKKEEN